MKKIIKNLIFSSVLLMLQSSVLGYNLNTNEVKEVIISNVQNETKTQLKQFADDIEISVWGIPQINIVTNENKRPKIEILSQNSNFQPNSYKRILIKDSKNTLLKSFGINVQTKIYKPTLVSSKIIPYNAEINSTNTKIERREISKFLFRTFDNLPSNLTASKNYQPGSIILSDCTKKKALVAKDSIVDIVFLSKKGLKIRLQGRALKEGSLGDTIVVRSDKYNKIYNARVNSSNEVIVRI